MEGARIWQQQHESMDPTYQWLNTIFHTPNFPVTNVTKYSEFYTDKNIHQYFN